MLPKKKPTHPGEFIRHDILLEFNLTQQKLAQALGVSRRTINEIIKGKRAITADMALRLGKFTKTSPETWLNLQNTVNLWEALHSPRSTKPIRHIQPCTT